MAASLARQRLAHLIPHLCPENLAEAALYIAQEAEPDLDVHAYLNALETMAVEVKERLPDVFYPLRIIKAINAYLFDDLGFRGNQQDYYDPRNSFLNHVIDRRTGIPITLSLVYLDIARRIEFPMVGVNFPGHFLIRPDVQDMDLHVDPFDRGNILFAQDTQAKLAQIYGTALPLQERFFQTITPIQFLIRMLTNLKQIYLHLNQLTQGVAVVERLVMLAPDNIQERRDRGILYYQLGRWVESRQDLTHYLESGPLATDQAVIEQLLKHMGEGV